MIQNPNLVYSAQFDLYVDKTTMVIYKRNNRHRKTEITDGELIPLRLSCSHNKYIQFRDFRTSRMVCISYAFADAFPDRVGDNYLHLLDPQTFSELDHRNHVHDTYESNFAYGKPRRHFQNQVYPDGYRRRNGKASEAQPREVRTYEERSKKTCKEPRNLGCIQAPQVRRNQGSP